MQLQKRNVVTAVAYDITVLLGIWFINVTILTSHMKYQAMSPDKWVLGTADLVQRHIYAF